ncbi:MAG TPA: AraC family transcriptional regulator [Candidatus Koribacter sp.]
MGSIRARVLQDTDGEVVSAGSPYVGICLHLGSPALVGCRRGDDSHSGVAFHGDLDVIPANTACIWRVHDLDTVLVVGLNPQLLAYAAEESGADAAKLLINNRFQIKDSQLERLCWALRDEMEAGYPSGPVFTDSLGTALAARLVHFHSSLARKNEQKTGKIAPAKLRQLLSFIEERLGENLTLSDLAIFANMSQSHLKAVFRDAMAQPIHRYIVQRRVERAAWLLKNGSAPIADIALQTGFSHQSHLALQMRRVLGQSPKDIRKRLE